MNMSEFKAWFEGFSEVMTGPPNDAQWARIKERVAQIDGQPTSYPVYLREHGYPVGREWWVYPNTMPTVTCGGSATSGYVQNVEIPFDAQAAFDSLGHADYQKVGA